MAAVDNKLEEVADAHLNSGRVSSVHCLTLLKVEYFLLGMEKCTAPGLTSARSLAAALALTRAGAPYHSHSRCPQSSGDKLHKVPLSCSEKSNGWKILHRSKP